MNSKIMSTGNLEDISLRLNCCIAMLQVIHSEMRDAGDLCDALYGARDLLCAITRDFSADIAGAADYIEEAAV